MKLAVASFRVPKIKKLPRGQRIHRVHFRGQLPTRNLLKLATEHKRWAPASTFPPRRALHDSAELKFKCELGHSFKTRNRINWNARANFKFRQFFVVNSSKSHPGRWTQRRASVTKLSVRHWARMAPKLPPLQIKVSSKLIITRCEWMTCVKKYVVRRQDKYKSRPPDQYLPSSPSNQDHC